MADLDSTWVPVLLFAALGFFFLQTAIRRGSKQSWAWGRGGGLVALSRRSYACVAATFFSISFILAHAPSPPMESVVLFLVCFLAALCTGFIDTYRYHKTQRLQGLLRNRRS